MSTPGSNPDPHLFVSPRRPARPRSGRALTVLLIAVAVLAVPVSGYAQRSSSYDSSSDSYSSDSSSSDSYSSDSYSSDGSGRRKNRSVFLSLFASHFIPGIAEGLSGWFRERLFGSSGGSSGESGGSSDDGGSSDAGDGAPPATEGRPPAARPSTRAVAASAGPTMHAGIAYEVLMLGSDGSKTSIDPAGHVFTSGERFEVAYRPNFPGIVEVFNVDPTGKVALIDKLRLQAAELGTLGPYEFVGEKGEDLLRIVLHPCKPAAATRGIARVEMRPEIDKAMLSCDQAEKAPARVATRSIAKVAREDGTAFALDPVSRSEIDSGRLAPREVVLRFRHE